MSVVISSDHVMRGQGSHSQQRPPSKKSQVQPSLGLGSVADNPQLGDVGSLERQSETRPVQRINFNVQEPAQAAAPELRSEMN